MGLAEWNAVCALDHGLLPLPTELAVDDFVPVAYACGERYGSVLIVKGMLEPDDSERFVREIS